MGARESVCRRPTAASFSCQQKHCTAPNVEKPYLCTCLSYTRASCDGCHYWTIPMLICCPNDPLPALKVDSLHFSNVLVLRSAASILRPFNPWIPCVE